MLKHQVIPVTKFSQNCCVIWCDVTKEAAIIDPGGDPHKLMTFVNQQQLKVTQILLTHGHIDHVGASADIAANYGVDIIGPHIGDKFWIDNLAKQAQMFGFETPQNFEPTHWLADGDVINVGNESLDILHCPGHTPGHVVFFSEKTSTAWVGDVIFAGSIGRTDFAQGNHQQLIDSICHKLWPLGHDVEFICGHGNNSTFGAERLTNPIVGDKITSMTLNR